MVNHTPIGQGIILVFDLDQTLIDSDAAHIDMKNVHLYFNPKIIDILRRCICHKGRGVDAIFLLTNNSSEEFVRQCDIALSKLLEYKSPYWNKESFSFFDNYMIRYDRRRTINNDSNSWVSKKLYDVRIMLDDPIKIKSGSYGDIARRTYFFDDMPHHLIIDELASYGYPDHYIHIKGDKGFSRNGIDLTDYSAIYRALDRLDSNVSPLNSLSNSVKRKQSVGYTNPISHRNMYRITNKSHRHIKGNSRDTKLNPILEEVPLHYMHKMQSRQKYCKTRRNNSNKKLNPGSKVQ